ncbi:MAG: CAP domain-containing protein [Xenococcus sp. MO_188.B8]|nr:CAP domain-containing protein [Xenococcus sp. MO_188.B8]
MNSNIFLEPSVYEQFMLELINRARSNPDAEAVLYDLTDLNQGLSPNTITSDPKQPLAFNLFLIDAARTHSQWISDTNTFSHTGAGGSDPGDRMSDAEYNFTGSWGWGENIAWKGTTGTPDVAQYIADEHRSLFLSNGHRTNILNGSFRELGIGTVEDTYTHTNNVTYNAVITTQDFAYSGSSVFLTGVAFNDLVADDDFYTIGEGIGEIEVKATRQSDNQIFTTHTMDAGGYQIALSSGTYDVEFSQNGAKIGNTHTVTINSQNVKLDLDTSNIVAPTPVTIGEVGRVSNFNHMSQTIQLDHSYNNPVVFVSPLSRNGGDPAIVRITDIQDDSFTAYLQESEYLDGFHVQETFNYLVLEAGTWQLADGTIIEIGTLDTNSITSSEWEAVNFQSDFENTPVILSQVQTKNGGQFVRTRQKQSNSNSFQLSLEEEEALKPSGHVTETVGWLAIESGTGTWNGIEYQASHTGNEVTHEWHDLNLEEKLTDTPYLFASLASYDGVDSAGLRYRNLNDSQVQIMIEEDRSLDSEIVHTTEIVDFFAIADLGELTATAYEPF